MKIRLAHVSITAGNLKTLAAFYENALGFVPARAEMSFSGEWLAKGTGVAGAAIRRVHLRFPGDTDEPPMLEIVEYENSLDSPPPSPANRKGLRHIAFETESVKELQTRYDLVLEHGGGGLGGITEKEIEGLGVVTFVYMTDPEGNIVELVNWKETA